VVTEGQIPNSDYRLVYDDEVRIYENVDALPRAFALSRAEWVSPADLPARLAQIRARWCCWTAGRDRRDTWADWPLYSQGRYSPNTVFVDVGMPGPAGWSLPTAISAGSLPVTPVRNSTAKTVPDDETG
jgi:hypothetical protein